MSRKVLSMRSAHTRLLERSDCLSPQRAMSACTMRRAGSCSIPSLASVPAWRFSGRGGWSRPTLSGGCGGPRRSFVVTAIAPRRSTPRGASSTAQRSSRWPSCATNIPTRSCLSIGGSRGGPRWRISRRSHGRARANAIRAACPRWSRGSSSMSSPSLPTSAMRRTFSLFTRSSLSRARAAFFAKVAAPRPIARSASHSA